MSQVSVSVSVEQEVANVLSAVTGLASAIKAGQENLESELAALVSVIENISPAISDFNSDLQGSLNAVVLGAVSLLMALK